MHSLGSPSLLYLYMCMHVCLFRLPTLRTLVVLAVCRSRFSIRENKKHRLSCLFRSEGRPSGLTPFPFQITTVEGKFSLPPTCPARVMIVHAWALVFVVLCRGIAYFVG